MQDSALSHHARVTQQFLRQNSQYFCIAADVYCMFDSVPKPFLELSVMLVKSDYGDMIHFR